IDARISMVRILRKSIPQMLLGDAPMAAAVTQVTQVAQRVRILGALLQNTLIFLFRPIEVVVAVVNQSEPFGRLQGLRVAWLAHILTKPDRLAGLAVLFEPVHLRDPRLSNISRS